MSVRISPKRGPGPGPVGSIASPDRGCAAKRADAAPDVKGALRAIGVLRAELGDGSPAEHVARMADRMDGAQLRGLVAHADGPRSAQRLMKEAPWAETLAGLEPGDQASIPALAIRPGQAQLSFDHAASKMAKLARKILDKEPDDLAELFDRDDFPVVVGPDGRQALLRDGHHKLTGLLGLSSLVHTLLGTGTGASSRTALNLGKAWKKLAKLVPPPDELEVPVFIVGQEAGLADGEKAERREADFISRFDDPHAYSPLYLRRRDGSVASAPPRRFGELQDNPYRRLAAELVAKLEWTDSGAPKLEGNLDAPLWLKGPDAPEFVEFYIAELLEREADRLNFVYQAGAEVPEEVRAAFRVAMAKAQDAEHPVLQKIIAFEGEVDVEGLDEAMALVRETALDFDHQPWPADDAIPIVILPAAAPDVHRLHAAARLLDALHEDGLEPEHAEPSRERALDVIRRLDRVHDDIGLWVNSAGRTTAELMRSAQVAQKIALRLEPHKKSKLEPVGTPPERPLWVQAPGVPKSAALAVGELLSDLLEQIEHDPERLEEIEGEARARLVEAKVSPDHPFYERLALVPVVVDGDAQAVAASMRLGRKKRTLELGHPVDGEVQPHVLAPRRQLRADD